MNPAEIVFSGNFFLALPIALLAGLVSAASPCVLPLIPGYVGMIAATRKPFIASVMFTLGFSLVFISLNTFSGAVGSLLIAHQGLITRIAGALIILMSLMYMGLGKSFQKQFHPNRATPFILGLVFAIGWTPCMGPVLVAVNALSLSGDDSSALRGLIMGIFYCLGLAVPFILFGLGFKWAARLLNFLRRHTRAVNIFGGVMLMLIGLAMLTGVWQQLTGYLQQQIIQDYDVLL